MGRINNTYEAVTEGASNAYHGSPIGKTIGTVSSVVGDVVEVAGKATLLVLSKAWIGIGLLKPAKTERKSADNPTLPALKEGEQIFSETPPASPLDFDRLYSLQLGDYFMPLSQEFNLRAKKKLNTSSLVDGIDIIQQTRKEAKTIECTIRIGTPKFNTYGGQTNSKVYPVNPNLQLTDIDGEIRKLSHFLSELYENDAIFLVQNDMINNTFDVEYVIMTDYRFLPKASSGTYTFEFSLMEVKYGENVLTFDLKQVDATQITDGVTETTGVTAE